MKYLVSFFLILSFPGFSAYADENPFKEGTEKVKLTSAQISDLKEYIDYVKKGLEDALHLAKGKTFDEAYKIFLKKIREAVKASNSQSLHSQLLMRIVLNQALHLTDGTFGGAVGLGVLERTKQKSTLTIILENSIELALQYYQTDRDAINSGSLIRLPYMKVAYQRLVLGRLWLSSIPENKYVYAGLKTLLQHWMNVVMLDSEGRRAIFAKEILRADKALRWAEDEAYTEKNLRRLRGVVRKLERGLAEKWKELDFYSEPDDQISGFFIRPIGEKAKKDKDDSFPMILCLDGKCFYNKEDYMEYQEKERRFVKRQSGKHFFELKTGAVTGSEGFGGLFGLNLILRTPKLFKIGHSAGIMRLKIRMEGSGVDDLERLEQKIGEFGLGYVYRSDRRTIELVPGFWDLYALNDDTLKVSVGGHRIGGLFHYSDFIGEKIEYSLRFRPTYVTFKNEGKTSGDIHDLEVERFYQLRGDASVRYHHSPNISLSVAPYYEKIGPWGKKPEGVDKFNRSYSDVGGEASVRWTIGFRYIDFFYEYNKRKSYGLTQDSKLQYDQHVFGIKGDVMP